ncbi:hypothetical protein [Paractinoplanes lichenicola]|uniref:Uncharacterized protein n=1 Tax=Paractinoplanes lichenicola TaxID=2802976 RepID=A0ABS1VLX3_9ACTN|nr:hypothetical protein [Actinoplanes lichenicola]MBL7255648.1 hypothetical protein [Actinoplanes lichenicola]
MRSLVIAFAAVVGLGVAAAPASAAGSNQFRLSAGSVVGYGMYENMMSIPERPVPPFRITGTMAGRSLFRCAVIQVGQSGPADGLEWRTFGKHCGPGRSSFRVQASYMFRGVKPPVRLCAGVTPAQAERGRQCDLYRPSAD